VRGRLTDDDFSELRLRKFVILRKGKIAQTFFISSLSAANQHK